MSNFVFSFLLQFLTLTKYFVHFIQVFKFKCILIINLKMPNFWLFNILWYFLFLDFSKLVDIVCTLIYENEFHSLHPSNIKSHLHDCVLKITFILVGYYYHTIILSLYSRFVRGLIPNCVDGILCKSTTVIQ